MKYWRGYTPDGDQAPGVLVTSPTWLVLVWNHQNYQRLLQTVTHFGS